MARNDEQTASLLGHAPPVALGRRPLPRKVRLRRDLNAPQLVLGTKTDSGEDWPRPRPRADPAADAGWPFRIGSG